MPPHFKQDRKEYKQQICFKSALLNYIANVDTAAVLVLTAHCGCLGKGLIDGVGNMLSLWTSLLVIWWRLISQFSCVGETAGLKG